MLLCYVLFPKNGFPLGGLKAIFPALAFSARGFARKRVI